MNTSARHRVVKGFVAAAIAFAAFTPARSADVSVTANSAISIDGQVQHPQSLTLAELQKMPATNVQASYVTGHGTEAGVFIGVLLWTLVGNATPIDSGGKNVRLRQSLIVTGRDGYAVALSIGELDPDFEGKQVILAYAKDGNALNMIRLIVPGDRHGGRAVKDVVSIEVR